MSKSYGLEYLVIIAAMAASLSVPVFASSMVAMTPDQDTTAPAQPSTVRTLGTISASDMQNAQTPASPPNSMDQDTMSDTLQPSEVNGVKYVTGGIGDEERATLDSMKRSFNLHIVSAGKNGEYVGNERVIISDRKGNEVLNVPAGPIMYAELPAGRYSIEARSDGQQQTRAVSVDDGKPLFIHFTWH